MVRLISGPRKGSFLFCVRHSLVEAGSLQRTMTLESDNKESCNSLPFYLTSAKLSVYCWCRGGLECFKLPTMHLTLRVGLDLTMNESTPEGMALRAHLNAVGAVEWIGKLPIHIQMMRLSAVIQMTAPTNLVEALDDREKSVFSAAIKSRVMDEFIVLERMLRERGIIESPSLVMEESEVEVEPRREYGDGWYECPHCGCTRQSEHCGHCGTHFD